MSFILIIAGLIVFSYGCHTFENRYVAKLGWLAPLVATYVGGLWLTGSHAAGAAAISLWFLLPWVEILGRVRKLRFPLVNEIAHRFPPSREVFPNLSELSDEAEQAGFVEAENTGWRWEETDHFMRLFYHAEQRAQAAVTLAQFDGFAVSYVSVTSRSMDGRTWTTSNYPFSFTMKFGPDHKINRFEDAESFEDLLTQHRQFLSSNGIELADLMELDVENLSTYLEKDMQHQIQHNVTVGVLVPTEEANVFRYSWRGCWFLWLQLVKDMLRV
jgi:hypothetical protein